MDRLKEISKRLEELGEDDWYTKDEKKLLEDFFGKKIDFARPGWVVFFDDKGGREYKGSFSANEKDFLVSICEKRIQRVMEIAKRIDDCSTDEEVMEICAKIMMDYAMSWKDRETCSAENERAKRILTSIRSIEVKQGRLVYEGKGEDYSAIVLDPYHGSIVVRRKDNGKYSFSDRVPLCGQRWGEYDSMHLKGRLIAFMDFIAY